MALLTPKSPIAWKAGESSRRRREVFPFPLLKGDSQDSKTRYLHTRSKYIFFPQILSGLSADLSTRYPPYYASDTGSHFAIALCLILGTKLRQSPFLKRLPGVVDSRITSTRKRCHGSTQLQTFTPVHFLPANP